MAAFEDDVMDFGDEDDAVFLTGKLAALGIDEDLELSGGEEENDDPSPTVADGSSGCPANSSSSGNNAHKNSVGQDGKPNGTTEAPSNDSSMRTYENGSPGRNNTGDGRQISAGQASTEAASPTSSRPRPAVENGEKLEAGELEPGELLQMLERPLQASRSNTHQGRQQQQQQGSSTRGNNKRRNKKPSTSRNNGRAKGRNVTVKECAKWVCERLEEPKYYLMCQVVAEIGYNNSKRLLEEVRKTEEAGGMPTADGARKRTPGGVFFTLLKQHIEPARLKALYADEIRVKKERERKRRAANKRKAEAADAGEDVTLATPRDSPRVREQRRRYGNGPGGITVGEWSGPTFDCDVKRVRAAAGPL